MNIFTVSSFAYQIFKISLSPCWQNGTHGKSKNTQHTYIGKTRQILNFASLSCSQNHSSGR